MKGVNMAYAIRGRRCAARGKSVSVARVADGSASLDIPGVELGEQIGRGGFATVYRGWQPAFHRAVAVKVLDDDPGVAPSARFRKEVRALGSLSGHPHVVAVYEAGRVGGCPYLIMPFLTGGSLDDRLRAHPLKPQTAVQIIVDIADAVAAAHQLGILHRDIKPANILFTAYGQVQLADFGIARLADATLTGGPVAATVTYAAPEVLGGAGSTEAADVYSLGATLYAALRGAPPFQPRPGEAPITYALRVLQEPVPTLRPPETQVELGAAVAKAMAKEPSDRYPSAAAFRDALRGVDRRTPVFFTPPPPPPPRPPALAAERVRRPKRKAAAVAALAVLGAALAAGLAGSGAGSSRAGQSGPTTSIAPPPTSPRTFAPVPKAAAPATAPQGSAPPTSVPAVTTPASGTPPLPMPSPPGTLTGSGPPPAGGATSASALPAATLISTINAYYALVGQRRLREAWDWLSPEFQQRIGNAYYHRFWEGISQVQLLAERPQTAAVALKIRYVETDGTVSIESAAVTFAVDSTTNRILIDGYRVG